MEPALVEPFFGNNPNLDVDIDRAMKEANIARAQAVVDIGVDIRKMINKQKYSDMVCNCKDGVQVYASRLFLMARSEVFRRMFLSGMVESQLSEITLQEISSTVLLAVMEFLYTGNLQEHKPKDWRTAYEILGAAKFFLLKGMELIVLGYLYQGVRKVEVDTEAAAKFLSVSVEFVDIHGDTVEFIAEGLVSILQESSWKLEHLRALTEDAFMYLIRCQTSTKNGGATLPSQVEFLRFKNNVLWCACKEFILMKNLAPHTVPPEFQTTCKLLEKPPVQRELIACERSEIDTIREPLASSVQKYLPLVDLREIPPQFLVHVVKPMDIIPSSAMMDALQFHREFHALQRHDKLARGRAGWLTSFKNHEIYRTDGRGEDRGSLIKQIAPGIGFAQYNFPLGREEVDKSYQFQIIIEEVCDGFIEIGLQYDPDGNFYPDDGRSLSGQPGGWALRMDAQGVFINHAHCLHSREVEDDSNLVPFSNKCSDFVPLGKDCNGLAYGIHYGHRGTVIKASLNLVEGTCSLSVDNEKAKVAWSGLPKGTFCPAISLGSGSQGAVRIFISDEKDRDVEGV